MTKAAAEQLFESVSEEHADQLRAIQHCYTCFSDAVLGSIGDAGWVTEKAAKEHFEKAASAYEMAISSLMQEVREREPAVLRETAVLLVRAEQEQGELLLDAAAVASSSGVDRLNGTLKAVLCLNHGALSSLVAGI